MAECQLQVRCHLEHAIAAHHDLPCRPLHRKKPCAGVSFLPHAARTPSACGSTNELQPVTSNVSPCRHNRRQLCDCLPPSSEAA